MRNAITASAFVLSSLVACSGSVDPPWDCGPAPLDTTCSDPCGFPGTFVCRDGAWVCPAASEACEVTACEDYGHDIGDCYDDLGERYDPTCGPNGEYVCIPPENGRLLLPAFPARWSDGFGGPDTGDVQTLAMDAQGNVYVTIDFDEYLLWDDDTILQSATPDVALVKYSPSGEKLWILQVGEGGADYGVSIGFHDGAVMLLLASSEPDDPSTLAMSLRRISSEDGSLLEDVPLPLEEGHDRYTRMVVNETTGDILFFGLTPQDVAFVGGETLSASEGLGFVAYFDSDLSPVWGRRLPLEFVAFFADVDAAGRVFLGGTYANSQGFSVDGLVLPAVGADGRHGFVLALEPDQGEAEWVRAVVSDDALVNDIEATEDGGVAFVGYFQREASLGDISLSSPPGVRAPIVGRINPNGQPAFFDTHGMQDFEGDWRGWQIERLNSGALFLAGSTGGRDFIPGAPLEDPNIQDQDIMLLRLDASSGGILWSDQFGDHRPNRAARLATSGELVAIAGTFANVLDVGQGPIPSFGVDGPSGFVASFDPAP